MGITDTARAKAQAAVSKAEADVIELTAKVSHATALLDGTDSAGELLDSVRDVAVVGSLTSGFRDQVDVDKAKQQADIDQLRVELSAAKSRLDRAKKAQNTVLAVVGKDDD